MNQLVKTYEKLAEAFHMEGVTTCFTLMGDGNMHWATTLAHKFGVQLIHGRHEHCVVAMATAYARASNCVGVASVTCGPGVSQIMTALTTAARAKIPLVVFAGAEPLGAPYYNQRIDQASLVVPTGAHYISANSQKRMLEYVQEAFRIARLEGRPVVLGVPYDLQSRPWSSSTAYLLSTAVLPPHSRVTPDPKTLDIVVSKVKQSKKIILIGGRGVELSDAAKSCMTFALSRGALLATTLPARGLFDDDPCALGVAGGFSTPIARAKFSEADLVIAVGASMAYHTSDGGKLFPNATVVQIDPNPVGFNQSLKVADIYLRSDAKLAMDSLLLALADVEKRPSSTWRSDDLAEQLDGEMAGYQSSQIETELLDPRKVGAELNRIIPKEWHIVSGSGHCAHFFSNMRGRGAGRFHCIREFGAIGNGLSYAIGVAVARPDAQIVLLDGDGSLLMHVQELETVRRYGLKLLIGIFNDGAYGSEIHVLRQDGLDEREAIFGRSNFAKLASGFGHRGAIVHNLDELEQQLEAFRKGNDSTIWDIQISDKIIASTYPKQARK